MEKLLFLVMALLAMPFIQGEEYDHKNGRREMKNKNILISGGGISALTLAYWLKEYGFSPVIIEKDASLRRGGYKIDIRGAALEVMKRMDLNATLERNKTDIQGATIIESGGKQSSQMDADRCGGRIEGDIEILRGDLCEVLFNNISDVECIFGDYITNITQHEDGLNVEFAKGESRLFDLVIGADGLHSNVRRIVFGDESEFLHPLGLFVSVYTIPNFLGLDRWEIEYFEPQKLINVYSSSKDNNAKVGFAFVIPPEQFNYRDREQQQQLLYNSFSDLGWEVPRLLAEMKSSPDFYFDAVAQVKMPCWSKGRVVLVGDAGYAPSPLAGQGTSVAIVGAYVLAKELAEAAGDYTIGFSQYENQLRDFVYKNQALVEMNTALMGKNENSWMAWFQKELIQLLPESVMIDFWKRLGVKRVHDAATAITL